MSYNVGVKNRFAELDSDVEAAPAQRIVEQPVVEAPVAPKARQERPARNGDRAPRPEGQRRERAPRAEGERPPRAEGERPPRGDRPPRKDRAPRTENAEENQDTVEEGKPIHNNRRGRGRAAPRTGAHDGLDRHSINFNQRMKKGGAGSHNWGKEGEKVEEKTEETVAEADAEAAAPADAEVEVEAAVEEKPTENILTYGDYMKELQARRANLPKKEIVKNATEVAESIENGKFKKHVKVRDEKGPVEAEERHVNSNRVHLFEFIKAQGGKVPVYTPKDERRAPRENNTRRAPRENNTRRGPRDAPRANPVNFDDAAFPSL